MPYLTSQEKNLLDQGSRPQTCGHLTYLLYKIGSSYNHSIWLTTQPPEWIEIRDACTAFLPDEPKFQDYAEMLGCIYAAALEIRRRKIFSFAGPAYLEHVAEIFYSQTIGPYEDKKIEENGDVK